MSVDEMLELMASSSNDSDFVCSRMRRGAVIRAVEHWLSKNRAADVETLRLMLRNHGDSTA